MMAVVVVVVVMAVMVVSVVAVVGMVMVAAAAAVMQFRRHRARSATDRGIGTWRRRSSNSSNNCSLLSLQESLRKFLDTLLEQRNLSA